MPLRINADDPNIHIKEIDLLHDKIIFVINGEEINLMQAKGVWFRRLGISYSMFSINLLNTATIFPEPNLEYHTYNHIKKEINVLIEYIYYALETRCRSLGSYFNAELNKLQVLSIAKQKGLLIPCTHITANKNSLCKLLEGKKCITKALSDGIYLTGKKNAYYTYTEKIDQDFVCRLNRPFCHSLIQEQISKKYELRSFYLNGIFYSMAIFSQSNSQTNVDFRKYDDKLPNRCVPYILPNKIENALRDLMNSLNLNTGSIDLIVDTQDNYYFLEINPVGQFGMVSQPCNYYLEKKVAEYLVQNNE